MLPDPVGWVIIRGGKGNAQERKGGTIMPTVTVEGPPLKDLDRKRSLTREITDALERAYGLPRQAYTVVIKENPPENVCVGGELICDRIAGRQEGRGE